MTRGLWQCVACGATLPAPIYLPLDECPDCGARYVTVRELKGAHSVHDIPVQRLVGSDELNVVQPIFFSEGPDSDAYLEYFEIAERAHDLARAAREGDRS